MVPRDHGVGAGVVQFRVRYLESVLGSRADALKMRRVTIIVRLKEKNAKSFLVQNVHDDRYPYSLADLYETSVLSHLLVNFKFYFLQLLPVSSW